MLKKIVLSDDKKYTFFFSFVLTHSYRIVVKCMS